MSHIDVREILKESMPVLSICAVISIFSGLFLSRNEELLKFLPGLLIILPSFMGINGNISSVISSRLSSSLHMGLIKPDFKRSRTLERNVHSMLIVSLVAFPILGFVAAIVNSFLGVSVTNLLFFPLITLAAGMTTALILMFISIFFSYVTYRNGLDPDNVVVPILTTVGDLVSISTLLIITGLVL